MPASAQMSCIEARWKPERTKQRWAAARISARRSDCSWTLARRMILCPAVKRANVHSHLDFKW